MLVYGRYGCFVMHTCPVCIIGSPHDLQFVNVGGGCKGQLYGRGILQSQSIDCLICSHECLLLFAPMLLQQDYRYLYSMPWLQ